MCSCFLSLSCVSRYTADLLKFELHVSIHLVLVVFLFVKFQINSFNFLSKLIKTKGNLFDEKQSMKVKQCNIKQEMKMILYRLNLPN